MGMGLKNVRENFVVLAIFSTRENQLWVFLLSSSTKSSKFLRALSYNDMLTKLHLVWADKMSSIG